MKIGLQRLLNTEDVSSFVKDCYPDNLFITKAPLDRVAELCAYTLDDMIAMRKTFVRASFWSRTGMQEQMTIENGDARKLFQAGMTIYFHELQSDRTDQWLRSIEEDLGLVRGSVSLSGFASSKGPGLPFHWDENSNFICQGWGKKRWRIVPNRTIKNPSIGHMIHHVPSERLRVEADGKDIPRAFGPNDVTQTITMEPGMVMFMPKGMWHDTQTLDDVSFHFNIQTRWSKWADVVRALINDTPAVYAEEMFRDKVPRGLSEEEFLKELGTKLLQLSSSFRDRGIGKNLYTKYVK
jgi:50S ribosomal protein L16 3-hydroxylase